jgi:hypothetical protein
MPEVRWLLLLHQIPPEPSYFRAKILRRLVQIGAMPVKNSAYLLPDTDDTREDFEWVCREITSQGGLAWLFRTECLVGFSVDGIQEAFRRLRDADYEELIATAHELDEAKLLHRFEQIKKIDFFMHPSRERVEAIIEERKHGGAAGTESGTPAPHSGAWVTRKGIKVDRIGSAWLIQRFIDRHAQFHFVDTTTYRHAAPDIRFDMYEGEFTHEGDLCTFEVLVSRHNLAARYPALKPIAEMVHDIDLKDGRYQHAETSGLARLIGGLCTRTTDDLQRLQQGGQIFDALYESFAS